MTFAVDNAFLPAILSADAMTDEEFSTLCDQNPELRFEMSAEGEIIVMPPTYSDTSVCNFSIAVQLGSWAEKNGRGYCCDSSGGFVASERCAPLS